MKPLNGEKTHPLSAHAVAVLTMIAASEPVPRQRLNPGVANRLERDALVEEFAAPSPFASHKGRDIAHFRITEAGRAAIAQQRGSGEGVA